MKEECYTQAKVAITFDLALGAFHRRRGAAWQIEQIAGRGAWFPPNVAHQVRWEREAELIEIYYEPTFWCELSDENGAEESERDALPSATDDPVIWDLALAICGWCDNGKPAACVITELGVLIGKHDRPD